MVEEVSARMAAALVIKDNGRVSFGVAGDRFILRFNKTEERDKILFGGPWFYGRSMFGLEAYDDCCEVEAVPIPVIPVWVEVFGLPPILMTTEDVSMIDASLGQVLQLDKANIHCGLKARVRISHLTTTPVKQACPPMLFEFGTGKDVISARVTSRYEKMVGFCRVCGLLEHRASDCTGQPVIGAF
ncbi:uncharacterized protein LOC133725908 [Rosa rugosa]|uniref:uncharacterized protein LOC133725908 n=1 Tax=Rosa rugosa TaxID=74645 RepID=UPI002B40E283|nr:uncharacterized protein LOC133725908 [Rosa rugosa]